MRPLSIICAVLGLTLAITAAWYWQSVLTSRLPEPVLCASAAEAEAAARSYQREHGGFIGSVLGTGSMVPWLPACPAGADPMTTFVAYSATRPGATFADVKPGVLCVYRASTGTLIIHEAAQLTAHGWIMTGLHNRRSDAERMTADNFVGVVEIVFVVETP